MSKWPRAHPIQGTHYLYLDSHIFLFRVEPLHIPINYAFTLQSYQKINALSLSIWVKSFSVVYLSTLPLLPFWKCHPPKNTSHKIIGYRKWFWICHMIKSKTGQWLNDKNLKMSYSPIPKIYNLKKKKRKKKRKREEAMQICTQPNDGAENTIRYYK